MGLDLDTPSRYQTPERPSSLLQRSAKPSFPTASFAWLSQTLAFPLPRPGTIHHRSPRRILVERVLPVCMLPVTRVLLTVLLYSLSDGVKLTHSWRGRTSQGGPGCPRSPTLPSHLIDEKAAPGHRKTMAAGSQLCALLSWPAWVALLQIPQLTAGSAQPL